MRSYHPSAGAVAIDGQDLRDVTRASLVAHVSVVPQAIGVFNASVLDNLRYARLDATLDECRAACCAVGLHDKIDGSFANGYHEVVGERGSKLSGGELQRLAIARVLLRDARVVLLDEATSNLDAETEAGIQEHLCRWGAGRTVVIVAHRLASIAHADAILAVRDGRIVEHGTREELLARKGYFYELWEKQRLG